MEPESDKPKRKSWLSRAKEEPPIAAWWIAFVTTVYAVIAGLQWCSLRTQQATMGGQLSVMQGELRPWVYAEPIIVSPLTFDRDGAHLKLKFVLHNVGHAPAIRAWPVPNMYPLTRISPVDEQRSRCDPLRKRPPTRIAGVPVFPGKDEPVELALNTMQRPDIDHALADRREGDKFISPIIGGCVVYESSDTDSPVRETGFIYHLFRTDPANPDTLFEIDPSMASVAIDHLRLQSDAQGGSFAD